MDNKIWGEIITSGTEMMLGRMVDTNSAWLSEALGGVGVSIARHTSVGDDLPRLIKAYQRAWEEHQVVVATGGLGPTADDLTRQAVAQAFGRKLEYKEDLATELQDIFKRHNYPLTHNNFRQAWLPQGTVAIPNSQGTAPGFALVDENRIMVFLPGVPAEMKAMMRQWVLPRLSQQFPDIQGVIKTVIMKTAGLGESIVDQLICDLMAPDRNPSVGLLAASDMVRVVVAARAGNEKQAEELLQPTVAELGQRLSGHVFGYGEISLAQVVAQLLKEAKLKLTIWDAVTQGRLCGTLGPVLDRENWNGAQEFSEACVWAGDRQFSSDFTHLNTYLSLEDDSNVVHLMLRVCPNLEPASSGETTSMVAAGSVIMENSVVVESVVHSPRLNGGQPLTREFRVGGEHQQVLSRVAALAVFHLWQELLVN